MMPEDGSVAGATLDDQRPDVWPLQHMEDDVVNFYISQFNNVPYLAPIGGAAGEEYARRSEEHQH